MREDEGIAHTVLAEAGLTDDLLTEMIRKSAGTGASGSSGAAQELSPRTKHVLEIAMEDAARGGYAYIGTEHLLAGILREGNKTIWQSASCGLPVWMPASCTQR